MFSGRANNNKTKIIYTRRAHEQFGYCQAGTSGMLLDDDTALIGTPGPYTWRGTVFAVSVSDDFLHRDKTLYYGPLTQDHSPVDKYSYLGTVIFWSPSYFSSQRTSRLPDAAGPAHKQPMESCVRPGRQPVIKEIDYRLISYSVVWFFLFFSSCLVSFSSSRTGMSVTAGKYFGSKVSYAAGAPRSNGTGQVVIFTKVKKAESQLRVQLVLSGEQFASSYGYQVATADLNGDRYKSIIFFFVLFFLVFTSPFGPVSHAHHRVVWLVPGWMQMHH